MLSVSFFCTGQRRVRNTEHSTSGFRFADLRGDLCHLAGSDTAPQINRCRHRGRCWSPRALRTRRPRRHRTRQWRALCRADGLRWGPDYPAIRVTTPYKRGSAGRVGQCIGFSYWRPEPRLRRSWALKTAMAYLVSESEQREAI